MVDVEAHAVQAEVKPPVAQVQKPSVFEQEPMLVGAQQVLVVALQVDVVTRAGVLPATALQAVEQIVAKTTYSFVYLFHLFGLRQVYMAHETASPQSEAVDKKLG